VKVERPVFDLAGVITSSLTFAGLAALATVVLGGGLGAWLILRHKRASDGESGTLQLGIDPHLP
jgi:hypothetical protein